jgi:hypothetical protein
MDSLNNILEDAIHNLQKEQCKVADLRVVLDKIKNIFGDD